MIFWKNQQYKIQLKLEPTCYIFIVYRVIHGTNEIAYLLGCADDDRNNPSHHAIGFQNKTLHISNGMGGLLNYTSFPKTNPTDRSIWHVLCVEWSPEQSSVWVNTKKVHSFTSNFKDQSTYFILAGMIMNDLRTWWYGSLAHVELYNSQLKDFEKYFIQKSLCATYDIPVDD